jgi:hypothetical protein
MKQALNSSILVLYNTANEVINRFLIGNSTRKHALWEGCRHKCHGHVMVVGVSSDSILFEVCVKARCHFDSVHHCFIEGLLHIWSITQAWLRFSSKVLKQFLLYVQDIAHSSQFLLCFLWELSNLLSGELLKKRCLFLLGR